MLPPLRGSTRTPGLAPGDQIFFPEGTWYRQDKQDEKLLQAKLTRSMIGCVFEVINELGSGFLESVYERAMMIALSEAGLSVQSQKPVKVRFREKPVGDFYADLLVEEEVVVELKVAKTLVPEHAAQTINYLNATGIQVGLLINFGKPTLEFKRFTRSNTDEQEYKTAVSRKKQDGKLLHEKLTGSMIRCGFTDARDYRTPDS